MNKKSKRLKKTGMVAKSRSRNTESISDSKWICVVISSKIQDHKPVQDDICSRLGRDFIDCFFMRIDSESENDNDGDHLYVNLANADLNVEKILKMKDVNGVFPSNTNPYFFSNEDIDNLRNSISEYSEDIDINDMVVVSDKSHVYFNLFGIVLSKSSCKKSKIQKLRVVFKFNSKIEIITIEKNSLKRVGSIF